ncbi:MAG: triose-phosphate isomerase [Burkholderiales bacterium]|nr:triose-phosphate isomerase [Burkholderiales bacterium]
MRQKIVAGNWKMNGSLAGNAALLEGIVVGISGFSGVECVVCAPFPYLFQVQAKLADSPVLWGAQNLSQYDRGAYTGEVSASMLKDFGATHVIVGHSERRAIFGETSMIVAEKFRAAGDAGLIPILCVGESLSERESGITERIVGEQLDAVIDFAGVDALRSAVLAYEPVWAIGTGRTATPQQAQDVHRYLRARIASRSAEVAGKVSILYGGSVKPSNAGELFAMPDIDGGLVGGASLAASEFCEICRAAA